MKKVEHESDWQEIVAGECQEALLDNGLRLALYPLRGGMSHSSFRVWARRVQKEGRR